MSSGDLVPTSGFAQTGTFDWVRLGDGLITFSVNALARMASHGVDPNTVVLAMQIAQQLHLSAKGEMRVRDAISSLRSFAGFENILSFGFGLASIPRLFGKHIEGLAFVAVSAALSEVYHEKVVAMVLSEMLLHQNLSRESTPSLQTWLKIVKACAGTLATTSFGSIAERFMSWHPREPSIFPTGDPEDFNNSWRSRSSTKDIAKALIDLGKISRKELESVTIVGGGDIGFLAAVAEWLFDMRIMIVDDTNELLHQNSELGSAIQARFVFSDRNNPMPPQETGLSLLRCSSKVVHVKDISDILFTNREHDQISASGRLEWNHCLSSAFGPQNLDSLLSRLKLTFGTALGCAARIFEAVANAEPQIDFHTRKNWIYYADAGNGYGYVQNLVYWFPELKIVEATIHEAAGFDYIEAQKNYESSIFILAQNCGCAHYTCTGNEHASKRRCLVNILETILKAALILSNVSVETGLKPIRLGFERMYRRQIQARVQDSKIRERVEKSLGPIVWVIEPERGDEKLYNIDQRVRLMFDGAMGLFTRLEELNDSSYCAYVSNGICAYRKILQSLSMHDDFGYSPGRIHIIPGVIKWHGNTFDRIQNWLQHDVDPFLLDDGQINITAMDFKTAKLLVEESLDSLNVAYELSNSKEHILTIPPAYLANNALLAHGLFRCQHKSTQGSGRLSLKKDCNFQSLILNRKRVSLYQAPNELSLCAILSVVDVLGPEHMIIRSDDCLDCVVWGAVSEIDACGQLSVVDLRKQ